MNALKDHSNKWSSKRIGGWSLLSICIAMALADMFTSYKANEVIFSIMFAGALALLGVETVVNGVRNSRNNQRRSQRRSNFIGEDVEG